MDLLENRTAVDSEWECKSEILCDLCEAEIRSGEEYYEINYSNICEDCIGDYLSSYRREV